MNLILRHLSTNCKSLINIVQSAAKGMIESGNGGSIVNILSLVIHNSTVCDFINYLTPLYIHNLGYRFTKFCYT